MGYSFFFYLFSSLLITSSLVVVWGRHMVHNVLFLIFCFVNASGLLLLMQAEFIAMSLVIVYIGAVAVLFLFVVMMLDEHWGLPSQSIEGKEVRREGRFSRRGIFLLGMVLLGEILLGLWSWSQNPSAFSHPPSPLPLSKKTPALSNTHALGEVLYTDYWIPFQTAGLILLVAMVGAMSLTLRHRSGIRRQNIGHQLSRKASSTVVLNQVDIGKGIGE